MHILYPALQLQVHVPHYRQEAVSLKWVLNKLYSNITLATSTCSTRYYRDLQAGWGTEAVSWKLLMQYLIDPTADCNLEIQLCTIVVINSNPSPLTYLQTSVLVYAWGNWSLYPDTIIILFDQPQSCLWRPFDKGLQLALLPHLDSDCWGILRWFNHHQSADLVENTYVKGTWI